jgi:hypothetical protein
MRRGLGEAAISLFALVVLLVALVSIDDRVRQHVASMVSTSPNSSELAGAGKEITTLALVVFDAVKDQSVAHAPMVIFALAATVLVLFMLRT